MPRMSNVLRSTERLLPPFAQVPSDFATSVRSAMQDNKKPKSLYFSRFAFVTQEAICDNSDWIILNQRMILTRVRKYSLLIVGPFSLLGTL